jgi:hypothetical protein
MMDFQWTFPQTAYRKKPFHGFMVEERKLNARASLKKACAVLVTSPPTCRAL